MVLGSPREPLLRGRGSFLPSTSAGLRVTPPAPPPGGLSSSENLVRTNSLRGRRSTPAAFFVAANDFSLLRGNHGTSSEQRKMCRKRTARAVLLGAPRATGCSPGPLWRMPGPGGVPRTGAQSRIRLGSLGWGDLLGWSGIPPKAGERPTAARRCSDPGRGQAGRSDRPGSIGVEEESGSGPAI